MPLQGSTYKPRCGQFSRTGALAAIVLLAAGLAGCRVHVQKDASGQQKNVQVDTPFGGVHVNTNQTTAADLGLPAYPGAQIVRDKDDDKSANIHMGFGQWELQVKVVNYSTPDSEDKVAAFYKKALGRYGDVIACQDGNAMGTPNHTSEGLTCADDDKVRVNASSGGDNYGYSGHNGFALKAGSKHHQHIVGFQSSAPGQTRFALVEIELPSEQESSSSKSD